MSRCIACVLFALLAAGCAVRQPVSELPAPGDTREIDDWYRPELPREKGTLRMLPDGTSTRIGEWRVWHREGDVMIDGRFDNLGRKTGVWTYYTMDGMPWLMETYRDGRLNGKTRGYNPDGSVRYEKNYRDGQPVPETFAPETGLFTRPNGCVLAAGGEYTHDFPPNRLTCFRQNGMYTLSNTFRSK